MKLKFLRRPRVVTKQLISIIVMLARKWPFMLPILRAMQTDGKAANS